MIDTVIISLPMTVREATTPGWDLVRRNKGGEVLVKNGDHGGGYFPRVTRYRRRVGNKQWDTYLRIECSLPKLVYGDNLNELYDPQFEEVITALEKRLANMGIAVSVDQLRKADVRAVHYSKNIILGSGYSTSFVIGELSKVNLNKRFDLAKVRYIEGESLCYYTSAHSFIAYDKVAEIENTRKYTPEKEQLLRQIEEVRKHESTFEVLRLEVRLNRTYKLRSLFKTLGFASPPTFGEVFSRDKSRAVLLHYWNSIIAPNALALFAPTVGAKEIFKQIVQARPGATGKSLIHDTGLLLLAADDGSMRELRMLLAPRINDRTWHRTAKQWRELARDLALLQPREWYGEIVEQLGRYPPLRLADLLERNQK